MKLEADTRVLTEKLSQIVKVISNNAFSNEMQKMVVIETSKDGFGLNLTGSNSYSWLSLAIGKENITVKEKGSLAVDAKFLLEILKTLNDKWVVIETKKDGMLNIKTETSSFDIPSVDSSNYPQLKDEKQTMTVDVNLSDLTDLIRRTAYCSDDGSEMREVLKGIKFTFNSDSIVAIATNSHVMSRVTIKCKPEGEVDEPSSLLIPAKSIKNIASFFDDDQVKLLISDTQMKIVGEGVELALRSLAGTYPNVKSILDGFSDPEVEFDVNRLDFIASLKRTKVVASKIEAGGAFLGVLSIVDGHVQLKAKSRTRMADSFEAIQVSNYQGADPFEIGLNVLNILNILTYSYTNDDEKIHFAFKGRLKPIQITAGDHFEKGNDQLVTPIRYDFN